MTPSPQIRQPCPPGACDCGLEQLLATTDGDLRILRLTRQEEKRLLERLENIESLNDLEKLQQRMYEQLGIRLAVAPGFNEVRSMRGIAIHIDQLPGLCRKTRQSLPTAIRRGLEKHPEIAYRLLDAHDLFRIFEGGGGGWKRSRGASFRNK
ncbi:hypothetical protein [Pseudomonas sp. CC6-YY-74]|uniref:hypothetical protein n=1 Tax=Pseudomonas sp. CC6-YY-74 TaxID=1930532 RepID=UPI002113999F|nr:hypothetical protein [Pseudomonas sp. CC6-YY-74]